MRNMNRANYVRSWKTTSYQTITYLNLTQEKSFRQNWMSLQRLCCIFIKLFYGTINYHSDLDHTNLDLLVKWEHRGGRVVRRCWINFQCRGVLLTWITVGQGPIVLAVGAGRGCLDIFSLIYHFSFLSPSLWETARYRLKYCLKLPLSPKQQTNKWEHDYNRKNMFTLHTKGEIIAHVDICVSKALSV